MQNKNLLKYVTLIFALLNCIYFWNDIPIDRPPMRDALKIVHKENINIKKIFTNEQTTFNHFLQNYNFSKNKEFEIKNIQYFPENMENEIFAIICLNNARFMVGENKGMPDSKTCLDIHKNENFNLLITKRIPDFLIHIIKFENKSVN